MSSALVIVCANDLAFVVDTEYLSGTSPWKIDHMETLIVEDEAVEEGRCCHIPPRYLSFIVYSLKIRAEGPGVINQRESSLAQQKTMCAGNPYNLAGVIDS